MPNIGRIVPRRPGWGSAAGRPRYEMCIRDRVYTDVWVSMGEPVEVWAERIEALAPYQVNTELMAKAKPTAVFMHLSLIHIFTILSLPTSSSYEEI